MSESNGSKPPARPDPGSWVLRVAATADVHARPNRVDELRAGFERVNDEADLLLIAGDLTSVGTPDEAATLAEACALIEIPVIAVLGNHDWHSNRRDEVVATLDEAGVQVVDPGHRILSIRGVDVGVVGVKGFVGGFPGSHLPDFGEPLLRQVYAEAEREVEALDHGLRSVAQCPLRLVVMHYAPIEATLAGEPREIFAFLGCDRLAGPILEHEPDLVVHGHAHSGTFEGSAGNVPVFNASVEVTGRPYWVFEVTPATTSASAIH